MKDILHFTEDEVGSVELMNYTRNGDLLVVNAARCSFDKEHGTYDEEKDTRLINYLAREKHLLPFRHPSATLRIYAPIFVFRQLGKHQVGFSWSEVSRRYISSQPEFWVPDKIRKKADNIKQGSSEETLPNAWIIDFHQQNKSCLHTYNTLLRAGAAPEQARAVLPQSMYTTCVVTGTLLGWHHLYTQRTEEHTQRETQEYARLIGEVMGELFPRSWEALNDNI
jgi:thymidylate synthase (FAD)